MVFISYMRGLAGSASQSCAFGINFHFLLYHCKHVCHRNFSFKQAMISLQGMAEF